MNRDLTILFSTNRMIGSRLIRAFTWSDYSHCDIVAGDGELIGAVPFKGVVRYPVVERLNKSTLWEIVTVPGLAADAVLPHAVAQIDKPYDWLGCLGIGLHRDWQEDDSWFCSELIAYACLQAGTPLCNPRSRINRITPQDLLDSPLVKTVAFLNATDPDQSFFLND